MKHRPPIASVLVSTLLCAGAASASQPHQLAVLHPDELQRLESLGLSFAERLTGARAESNAEIPVGHGYETLVKVLKRDLARLKRGDKRAGVGTRHAHRLFDIGWLTSPGAHFELVGVVNRIDRAPFSSGRCGETRLVYRLAYTTEAGLSSRLPMTLNLVYWQRGASCVDVAERWSQPALRTDGSQGSSAPLSERHLSRENLKSVEVNLQSVRWPSTVHPSLGGHAEYLMRVFEPKGAGLAVGHLENTPDVVRLRRDRRLKAELLAWLNAPEHQEAIASGVFQLPERFLARSVSSVTPRGLARLANRPFAQLFSEKELQGGEGHKAPSLLRRLDGRTCSGCHQSRSLAGFHLPGEDPPSQSLDALAVGRSPHFIDDQVRRRRFIDALSLDGEPSSLREHPEVTRFRGRGARCSADASPGAALSCDEGLVCGHIEDPELGTCMSPGPLRVGEACEPGELKTRAQGHKDRLVNRGSRPCDEGLHCETTAVGFPGGMCAGTCEVEASDSVCGAIALLTPFNRCIASGKPFTRCLVEETRPARLARCDPSTPCRDDYLCARISGETGSCIPPYFLFQMRVDGH